MKKGWIALNRKMLECFLWSDKPFARGQAWIDMLLLANHAEKKFMSKGELVTVERGSFLTSDAILADRWGWGRKKVRMFLKLLESETMLVLKRNSRGTTISIVKYSDYQDFDLKKEQPMEQQKNNAGTSEEHLRNTNNNDNNVNNDNNKDNRAKSTRFVPPTDEEVKAYCLERKNNVDAEQFIDFYETKGWMVGKNKMKDWKAAVRTWEKRDSTKQTDKSQQMKNKFKNFTERNYTDAEFLSMEQRLLRG